MKLKHVLIIVAAMALVLGLSGMSFAFHAGGVAGCEGCHAMTSANTLMLDGADPSSTCLNCHSQAGSGRTGGYHIESTYVAGTGPANMTPGGDFGWITKTYTWSAHGRAYTSLGDDHGHNILADDYGYVAEVPGGTGPGGTYPNDKFSCASCHDPHGEARRLDDSNTIGYRGSGPIVESGSYGASPAPGTAVGAYRLLGGVGYQSSFYGLDSTAPVPAFTAKPPAAVLPSSYNGPQTTADLRVAYGAGMTAWCGNCHGDFLNGTLPKHNAIAQLSATDPFGNAFNNNYNAYVKSGDLSGLQANAWTELVPFALGTSDYTVLNAKVLTTDGPGGTDTVMCLSCHRAHASGWDYMMRWLDTDDIIEAGLYVALDGRTYEEVVSAYHGKPETRFASSLTGTASPLQRSLCNKCHVED